MLLLFTVPQSGVSYQVTRSQLNELPEPPLPLEALPWRLIVTLLVLPFGWLKLNVFSPGCKLT